jgi:hypothetical protein
MSVLVEIHANFVVGFMDFAFLANVVVSFVIFRFCEYSVAYL